MAPRTSIKLVPKQHSSIFSVCLYLQHRKKPLIIGELDQANRLFVTKRMKQHLHKLSNSFAFNYELISKIDFDMVQVKYEGKNLYITKNRLQEIGICKKFKDYELQIFVPLDEFSYSISEAHDNDVSNQLEIFN